MLSTAYKGREIQVELTTKTDLTGRTEEYVSVSVNGSAQFSYQKYTSAAFAFEQTARYIDAVDAADEKARRKYAVGGYVEQRNADFADSWRS